MDKRSAIKKRKKTSLNNGKNGGKSKKKKGVVLMGNGWLCSCGKKNKSSVRQCERIGCRVMVS